MKTKRSDVPSNWTKDDVKLSIGVATIFLILIIIGCVWWCVTEDYDRGIAIGIAIVCVVAIPIVYKLLFLGASVGNKCPSCGVSFHIKHDNEETITESVIDKYDKSKGSVHYRVGVKRVEWHCENCGYKGVGEIKYEEKA